MELIIQALRDSNANITSRDTLSGCHPRNADEATDNGLQFANRSPFKFVASQTCLELDFNLSLCGSS